MTKIYTMLIEHLRTKLQAEYESEIKGSAPAGWKCIEVCSWREV